MKVRVVPVKGKKYLQLRWELDGKSHQRSSGTTRKREAERKAVQLEKELAAEAERGKRTRWEVFVTRAAAEHFVGHKHRKKFLSMAAHIDTILGPEFVDELTSNRLAILAAELRENELASATIASGLSTLRAGLNWAVRSGLLGVSPDIPRIRVRKKARGRPLTDAEFESMIERAERLEYPGLVWAMWVMWHSGLRIAECLDRLAWDDPNSICVNDLDAEYPSFWIPAGMQKNGQEAVIPMAPGCVELLRSVPAEKRTGPVCQVLGRDLKRLATDPTVIRLISHCGSHIITSVTHRGDQVTASSHDLRRSFGFRMAALGIPSKTLMLMMRHQNISTTEQFYLSSDASANAEIVWKAFRRSVAE